MPSTYTLFLLSLQFVGSFSTASLMRGQINTSTVPKAKAPSAMLVDIQLERRKDGKVEAMDAGHVFQPGEIVRLKLTSHYDGFLYVLDQGTSGAFSTVFPSAQTGSDNRIQTSRQYLVPAVDEGWFEVAGPPGYDLLFFLLSPVAISTPAATTFVSPGPASSLRPRCNDAIFRARGECTDDTAGPAAVPPGVALPQPLAPLAQGAARDLVFVDEGQGKVGVTAPATTAPVLYTFRLAHL